jgi:hypothetical protein
VQLIIEKAVEPTIDRCVKSVWLTESAMVFHDGNEPVIRLNYNAKNADTKIRIEKFLEFFTLMAI